jgi:hypothetical protein
VLSDAKTKWEGIMRSAAEAFNTPDDLPARDSAALFHMIAAQERGTLDELIRRVKGNPKYNRLSYE